MIDENKERNAIWHRLRQVIKEGALPLGYGEKDREGLLSLMDQIEPDRRGKERKQTEGKAATTAKAAD